MLSRISSALQRFLTPIQPTENQIAPIEASATSVSQDHQNPGSKKDSGGEKQQKEGRQKEDRPQPAFVPFKYKEQDQQQSAQESQQQGGPQVQGQAQRVQESQTKTLEMLNLLNLGQKTFSKWLGKERYGSASKHKKQGRIKKGTIYDQKID